MKKGIILLNGEPYQKEIDETSAYVVCADGGYNWAKGKVRIDENVGDFDSATSPPAAIYPAPVQVYPSEKDYTDGEIALKRMLTLYREGKIDKIEIYGGGGGREDHFLGNLHLLFRAKKEGLDGTMYTNTAQISVQTGKFTLKGVKGKTLSLLPFFSDAEVSSAQGVYYKIENLTLQYGTCRGISNVAIEDEVSITVADGYLLTIVNTEKG